MFAFDPALAGLWGTTITAASGVIVAILLRQNKTLGKQNGKGNLVQMMERIDERSAATHLLLQEHLKHHEASPYEGRH